MLRISLLTSDSTATVRLDGKLLRPWVDELHAAVDRAAETGSVRLDLEGLTFIDQAGAEAVRDLSATGVLIEGASPLISELLAIPPRQFR